MSFVKALEIVSTAHVVLSKSDYVRYVEKVRGHCGADSAAGSLHEANRRCRDGALV